MRYAYELTHKNGSQMWNFQDYLFTEEQILNACKESEDEWFKSVVSVRFHKHIPNGWHLCGCGNLVKGTNEDLLCDECREIYGHKYASEL